RLAIFDSGLVQLAHAADSFGRERGDGLIRHLLDEGQALAFRADQGIGADLDVLESDFRSAAAIDGRIVARRNAGRGFVDDEDRDAVTVALTARGARGDDELLRPGRAEHNSLVAIDRVARAVLLRGRHEVGKIVAALRFGIGESPDSRAVNDT